LGGHKCFKNHRGSSTTTTERSISNIGTQPEPDREQQRCGELPAAEKGSFKQKEKRKPCQRIMPPKVGKKGEGVTLSVKNWDREKWESSPEKKASKMI